MNIQFNEIDVLKFHLLKKNCYVQSIFSWLSISLVLFSVGKELINLPCGINKEGEKKGVVFYNQEQTIPFAFDNHVPLPKRERTGESQSIWNPKFTVLPHFFISPGISPMMRLWSKKAAFLSFKKWVMLWGSTSIYIKS